MSFSCTDKDTLIAYVYGECDAETRSAVEAHLQSCPSCAGEAGGFGRVRTTLAEWTPPDRVGSFRLVRDEDVAAPAAATVLRPARWWQAPVPALAKVAAAILLFAGGAAMANLEVRYDKDGWVVRTGWQKVEGAAVRQAVNQPAAVAAAPAEAPAAVPASLAEPGAAGTPWRTEMAALERQLRDEFRQQLTVARAASVGPGPVGVAAGADASERRVLAIVQAMIDDSAQRQQLWTAYRINQVVGGLEAQRRAEPASTTPRRGTPTNNLFPVTLKK
jgi:anti-sigma factor RsiW